MQRVRVVTYNILSSKLSEPSYHINCKPENLDPPTRFGRILQKLKAEVTNKAIICLQEVPLEWKGKLTTFFSANSYNFIATNYGTPFSGYMGVSIAYPTKVYTLKGEYDQTVGEVKKVLASAPSNNSSSNTDSQTSNNNNNTQLQKKTTTSWFTAAIYTVLRPFSFIYKLFTPAASPKKAVPLLPSYWELAERRYNRMLTLRLAFANNSKEEADVTTTEEEDFSNQFSISTYHMPCMYQHPQVMVIHAALAMQYAQHLAKNEDNSSWKYPHIVVGDWNFQPNSPPYNLVTTNTIDDSLLNDSKWDCVTKTDDWKYKLLWPMVSAYKELNGKEPEYTNYAQTVGNTDPFCECLDYIFMSSDCKVEAVAEIAPRESHETCLPTATEPSDHVMIAADISIQLKQ